MALIGVRAALCARLSRELSSIGGRPCVFSVRDISEGRVEADTEATGWIWPRGCQKPLRLADFAGSMSEPEDEGADMNDEMFFEMRELSSVVSCLRLLCPNPLNGPRVGSHFAFPYSLPEQWAKAKLAGIEVPRWGLAAEGNSWINIIDVFDPSLRGSNDATFDKSIDNLTGITVRRPVGPAMKCSFVGDVYSVCRMDGGARVSGLSDCGQEEVGLLVKKVRRAFDLDYGKIFYSFCGCPAFWSVVPFLDEDIEDGLLHELARMLMSCRYF